MYIQLRIRNILEVIKYLEGDKLMVAWKFFVRINFKGILDFKVQNNSCKSNLIVAIIRYNYFTLKISWKCTPNKQV